MLPGLIVTTVAEVKALVCELPAKRWSAAIALQPLRAASPCAGSGPSCIRLTHASWLNQIEIYFSILQRKALTSTDVSSQDAVAAPILGFQEHYERISQLFEWQFNAPRRYDGPGCRTVPTLLEPFAT